MSQTLGSEGRISAEYSAARLDNRMLSDQVASFLIREIMLGKLKHGQRINEAEIARHLGISRNPIREAVRRLEERGVLVSAPRRGTFVRTFTKKDIDDIFAFRLLVENFALENGLAAMTDAHLREITSYAVAMEDAARNNDEIALVENDLAFHLALCKLSDNHQTLHAFLNIQAELQLVITMAEQRFETLEEAATDHWPVVRALETRDLDKARTALREHIEDSWSRLADVYERHDAGSTPPPKPD
ncbi:DNA-binding GntR family transcriptional regulator [Pseudochelatococcus lubricantis]|uniref:DNA-binding GntR family transcriptional regulator n=1 Tax=Pseudochelatococcus lubricantis TaxID=1538102 RepID=A0ABX0UWE9_9HYPH|nr:GntR family transcriptional regulator [Pseudochelatococcus lubricantis]NIJ56728.1 DNA-binding GntR family transcriptional regulator [Pseudochelatococcus lubricantis]